MDESRELLEAKENPYKSPAIGETGLNRQGARWWIRSGNWPLLAASAVMQIVLWDLYLSRPPLPQLQNAICLALLVGMGVLLAWRVAHRLRRQLRPKQPPRV
ncbi:MAG TPA: hypothetical protein VHX65_16760 [Pirellulales bacterium]|jgi:hypothetical protein|nr:hypothetical protein [Pirellulales bacterium]